MLTKEKAQIKHAKFRAKTRFGVDLTPALRKRIVTDIQNGRASFIGRSSNRVTIWRYMLPKGNGFVSCRVVYDKYRKNIATVMHPYSEQSFHYVKFEKYVK